MAYPSYDQLEGSIFIPADNPEIRRHPLNGEAASFTLMTTEPGEYRVRHILTLAEWATLWANYTSNRFGSQSFTWLMVSPNITVNVYWIEPPVSERFSDTLVSANSRLFVAT